MINYIWRVSAAVNTQLKHLPPDLKKQVRNAMDMIRLDPDAGKSLAEELAGFRSYRLGKYRLIYRIKEDRLILEALGPRSSIYERFVLEIGRAKIRERAAQYRSCRRQGSAGKAVKRRRAPTLKRAP